MKRALSVHIALLMVLLGFIITATWGTREAMAIFPGDTLMVGRTAVSLDADGDLTVDRPDRWTRYQLVGENTLLVSRSPGGDDLIKYGYMLLIASLMWRCERRMRHPGRAGAVAATVVALISGLLIWRWVVMRGLTWSDTGELLLLTLHVVAVTGAYCLMAAMPFMSVRRMRRMVLPAVTLLTVGICLGSVWALHAWGRYWAWDPKETCALVTLAVYCVPLHFRLTDKAMRLFAWLGLAAVLFTYLGVKFLLGGLHAAY